MKIPVCRFDLESDTLCTNCQERLDKGKITSFDIEFCKWLLEKENDYSALEDLNLQRAIKVGDWIILVVKKRTKASLLAAEDLIDDITKTFGEVIIIEGSIKLRKIVRTFVDPAVEVGVNSLHLPGGYRESIVILRAEDKERIPYTTAQLKAIVSAIVGESVLFEYDDKRLEKDDDTVEDEFEKGMRKLSERRRDMD
ncbi:MAG: hypothetical protein RTU09_05535 [Candidatus Thorarchaeota archaeon]